MAALPPDLRSAFEKRASEAERLIETLKEKIAQVSSEFSTIQPSSLHVNLYLICPWCGPTFLFRLFFFQRPKPTDLSLWMLLAEQLELLSRMITGNSSSLGSPRSKP